MVENLLPDKKVDDSTTIDYPGKSSVSLDLVSHTEPCYIMVVVRNSEKDAGIYQPYGEAMKAIEDCHNPVWKCVKGEEEGKQYIFEYLGGIRQGNQLSLMEPAMSQSFPMDQGLDKSSKKEDKAYGIKIT